jgi:hypothetical protein
VRQETKQAKTERQKILAAKVGNRLPGGCVGVLADNWGGKRIGKTKTSNVLGDLVY